LRGDALVYLHARRIEFDLSNPASCFTRFVVTLGWRMCCNQRCLNHSVVIGYIPRNKETVSMHANVGLSRLIAEFHPTAHALAYSDHGSLNPNRTIPRKLCGGSNNLTQPSDR